MAERTVDAPDDSSALGDEATTRPDDATAGLSTQPADSTTPGIKLGPGGWLRWAWRQLTSMRTALLLLFLLALASIPGSLLPQRSTDAAKVTQYLTDKPGPGAFFDSIGFFDVFAAPWFVAIYVLLCVSITGCVLPRARLHWRAMRATPPAAPARLSRFAESRSWLTTPDTIAPQEVLDKSEEYLQARRWRVISSEFDGTTGWVSAEKGYLRETGNLVFHVAVLVLLFAVAFGGLFGWRGQTLVVEGEGFSDTITQYDTFKPGRMVSPSDLPPFSFTLDDFKASYQEDGEQRGAPREFSADVTYRDEPGVPNRTKTIAVNSPLNVDGAKVFLIGHGYAPQIKVTDPKGQVIYDAPTVFLPADANFSSNGVVKMPDADPQLGLQGIFLPTAFIDPIKGPISTFPAANDPAVFLSSWEGNLGLDNGVPQNVYRLDMSSMKRTGIKAIRPGESWQLPNGRGTVTFTGVSEYATFDVAHDPGKEPALIAALFAIAGLMASLFVPRRRVWVRVTKSSDADNRVEVAGLSRTDEAGLRPAIDQVGEAVMSMAPPKPEDEEGTLGEGSAATGRADDRE